MKFVYSDHARKRLRQRGITELEVEHVLQHPQHVKKTFEGKKEAVGIARHRTIKVIFVEEENYIKIITVL